MAGKYRHYNDTDVSLTETGASDGADLIRPKNDVLTVTDATSSSEG